MLKSLKLGLLSAALLAAQPVLADGGFGLGRAATDAEVAAWDIDVRPDGAGLPEGSGSVFDGEEVYFEKCAVCHGDFGEAVGRWPVLAGGYDTLTSDRPVKTVGSYWPYLSTVWDYVHRAMPFGDAQSLTDDEVYSITAYILYLNDLVDDDFELSKENFAEVTLPNQDAFYMDDREESPVWSNRERCMTNCKDSVEIVARAAVLDVTPEDAAARKAKEAKGAAAEEPKAAEAKAEPAPAAEPVAVAAVAELDPALVEAGEKAFRQCKACHQVGDGAKNRVGPHLNAVFGRPAGGLDGFRYSKAMTAAGEGGKVWDDATMAAFLAAPKKVVPKTKMAFRGVKKEKDIDALIAYIKANGG
ncbi:MAG: c-type cytochrome [Alphaproteobacteria bacterium]|nr:c-type cytochrome [Alphaproteobacteria bacterium]